MIPWTLSDNLAAIPFLNGRLEIELTQPDAGLQFIAENHSSELFRLAATDPGPLPALGECYLRQGDLLAEYPQANENRFGFHLQLKRIDVGVQSVLELVVAVNTNLLDCHPMLDLHVPGTETRRHRPTFQMAATLPPPSMPLIANQDHLAAPITEYKTKSSLNLAVMLPPRDWPVTGYYRERIELPARFRLFEEFLEKGVIRKSRVWLAVIDQAPFDLGPMYAELCGMPLPLAT